MDTKIIIVCDGFPMTDGIKEAIHNQYTKVADFLGTKPVNVKLSTGKSGHSMAKAKVICASQHNEVHVVSKEDDDLYSAINQVFDTLVDVLAKEHKMKTSVTARVTDLKRSMPSPGF